MVADRSIVEEIAKTAIALNQSFFGSLPLTPGGLGFVELGLTSLLVEFGGGQAEVVAAVLVYRVLTIAPTLVLGLLAAATWRRHNPGALEIATDAEVTAATRASPG